MSLEARNCKMYDRALGFPFESKFLKIVLSVHVQYLLDIIVIFGGIF